jgi:flagellar biosynthesis protein FlhF
MRLHTFRARTLPEAMRLLRDELGADAVIVASRELAEEGGGAEVTAAAEPPGPDEEDLAALLTPAAAGPILAEVKAALAFHAVPAAVAQAIEPELERDRPADAASALAGALARAVRFEPLGAPAPGRTLAVVGPPGAGKTAVVARLAAAARLAGLPARVVCADPGRAGAFEQLTALLAPLGLAPEAAATPAQAPAGGGSSLTLVDTGGVNPFRAAEVAALARWLAPGGAEAVLALPAGTDAQDAVETVGRFAAVGARRCVVTRLDAARRLGGVVAAGATGVALAEASVSPLIGKPMPPLTPGGLARLLLRR